MVHPVVRVPDCLEFAEGLHQFLAVHHRQEFGLGLAVAVLARQRAAVLDDQFGGLAQETAPDLDALGGTRVEGDAGVDAAVAEVSVERGLVAVAVDQCLEFAQVVAEAQRIDRGVFPADDRIRFIGMDGQRGGRGRGFADGPDALAHRRVGDQPGRGLHDACGLAGIMVDQGPGLRAGGINGFGTELDHDPGIARRQQRDVGAAQPAFAQAADDALVETFGGDRPEGEDFRNGVAGLIDVGEAQHQDHPRLRTGHQPRLGFQRDDAGAFAADQRARDVEAVFRQQLIEVVAGDAALDFRETRANQVGVLVAQVAQPAVDLAAAAAGADDAHQFVFGGRADGQTQAVIGQDVQRLDVVDGLARHHRMRAAGIVADHAAQRAAAVGRRIRAEGQRMFLRGVAQRVADRAGLDTRGFCRRIDFEHAVQVFRGVDDHGDVDALAVLRSAAAAGQDRRAELAADIDCFDDVPDAARQYHADGNLAVIRGVGGIGRPRGGVETDFAGDAALQLFGQGGEVAGRQLPGVGGGVQFSGTAGMDGARARGIGGIVACPGATVRKPSKNNSLVRLTYAFSAAKNQ